MIPKCFISLEEAIRKRIEIKDKGETLVLTNGCFDLLHAGHLFGLQNAATFGNHLWVAMNSDASVKKNKGLNRPIVNEIDRAYSLASLKYVSEVIIFNTQTLEKEINSLKPDVYVKSSDYDMDTLDPQERNALEKVGSKICFVDILKGMSTTNLIQKIQSGKLDKRL